MPFKKFPDEEGDARAHPVAFGQPAPNGNASLPFKKALGSDAKQADGFVPLPNLADNTRRSSRNKSPLRAPAVARARSPSRASPINNGMGVSPPTSSVSIAHDPGLGTLLPSYHSTASTGRFFQKSPVPLDNDLNKSSSKLRVQDANMAPAAPSNISNTQNLPALSMRSSSETRELRTRHSSLQEPASRFFAGAIQQLKPTEDGNAASLSAEQQRDEMAKGRRLRRFNDPIAKGSPVIHAFENQSAADQAINKRAKGGNKSFTMDIRDDVQDNSTEPEGPDSVADRDWQSSEAILGNCPDMCPESERLERERKGDLDRLERLDGDRNQTNIDLAVKKYTRTAEKLASLIRPIAVLSKTMNHLLHLLNRKYDEELLNLHNFLWDRMRAIRMDLRMQHIFNKQSVVMHEQMIRFHILAMHELCEYAKGEGFSEGFDAHLNIEQMNKASVDLFHMYDDLRKSGNMCASEAEFRGYYALLKLDKHPGYVVEPAELSLDLAKMTPEMRSTAEVQFARKVARACRSGNYLAFFRLARDATYLQACLMHAHFSKLRSQAMAALHSGLQRNQGIPIVQVEDWLGIEGEDIEALLEYHGFSLKNYEEPYMVKEGPFLNQGKAFQTRRSKLVEEKRSQIVKDDVLSSGQEKVSTGPVLEKISSLRRQSDLQSPMESAVADEEMPDYEEDEQPQESSLDHLGVFSGLQGVEPSTFGEAEMQIPAPIHSTTDILSSRIMQESSIVEKLGQDDNEWFEMGKRRKSASLFMEETEFDPKPDEHIIISRDKKLRTTQDPLVIASPQAEVVMEVRTQLVEADWHQEKERQEALKAELDRDKVRLLLRKWRERAVHNAEERQWRQQKLEAALRSFHVGLPAQSSEKVFFSKDILGNHAGALAANTMDLDFMQTEDRRSDKIKRMWTELDVIGVVASVLKLKNPSCKFLCWKLVMYSHVHDSDLKVKGRHDKCGEWLLAKILHQMPSERVDNDGIFSAGISDDSVYVAGQLNEMKTPVVYVARDLQLKGSEMQDMQACKGASAILFLVSENASLGDERRRLHTLVNTLQSGVKLPLLVVYTKLSESTNIRALIRYTNHDDTGALAKHLDLDNLDKSKVSCWTVLPILESYEALHPLNMMGSDHEEGTRLSSGNKSGDFYSEDLLKKGLSWLASKAPMQPNLRCVHVQDLVIEHLQPSVKLLSTMEPSHVTPEMCVKTFNDALLKTANEVNSAATDFHFHWPPDELRNVLEKLMGERTLSLPSPGWNEATYLGPIVEALSLCQLPEFPVISITIKSLGNNVSLKRQKAALEHTLHCYVNQICRSKHADPLTLHVVDAIIQKGCVFQQTALGRLLIPNWPLIFQHLYHTRLALLSSEPPAVVWVQIKAESYENVGRTMSPDAAECLGPTLDEMIEMESQEIFLQRGSNTSHVPKVDRELIDVEMNGRLQRGSDTTHVLKRDRFTVSGMNRFEDSRQESTEALQKSLDASRVRPDFTEAIELPTEGELELERMMSDFCRRVDQQVAEAAKFEESQATALYEAKHFNDQFISSTAGNQLDEITESNVFTDSCVDGASSCITSSRMWATNNGMDSLTQLLQHCENVQNRIDRTLRECFNMGEPKGKVTI
eukprot:c24765_g1_i1 orf=235-5052(+)